MEKRIKKGLLLLALAAEVVFVSIPVPVMAEEEEYLEIVDAKICDEETTIEVVEDVTTEEKCIDVIKQRQIRVALIDTGIDTTNGVIKGHIADGYDASNMSDVNGHGTLMAEIIASNTNENVKIVPYQVFNENGKATVGATYNALLKAIKDEADVISLSISGYGTSNLLTNAIAKAKEAGIYVVVAAGNDSDNADNYMPGNVTDAITVSATDVEENGNKIFAEYSNYGSCINYSAYGTIVKDKETENPSDDDVYEGTSISAAKVSSYIATMLQYIKDDETTENDEVLDALNSTVEDLGDRGRDNSFGVGYLSLEGIQKYIADKVQLEEVKENESKEETAENNETIEDAPKEELEEETTVEYPEEEGNISNDEADAEQELKTANTQLTDMGVFYTVLDKETSTTDADGGQDARNFKTFLRAAFANEGSTWDLLGDITLPRNESEVATAYHPYCTHACSDLNIDINCTINGWFHTINTHERTIVVEAGTTTINYANIVGGSDNITVHSGAKLVLNNCSVGWTVGGSGNCIYVASGGVVELNNCTVYNSCNGVATQNGCCVSIDGGTATINGGNYYDAYGSKGAIDLHAGSTTGVLYVNSGATIHNATSGIRATAGGVAVSQATISNCDSGIRNAGASVSVYGEYNNIYSCNNGIYNKSGSLYLYSYPNIHDNTGNGIYNQGSTVIDEANVSNQPNGIYNEGTLNVRTTKDRLADNYTRAYQSFLAYMDNFVHQYGKNINFSTYRNTVNSNTADYVIDTYIPQVTQSIQSFYDQLQNQSQIENYKKFAEYIYVPIRLNGATNMAHCSKSIYEEAVWTASVYGDEIVLTFNSYFNYRYSEVPDTIRIPLSSFKKWSTLEAILEQNHITLTSIKNQNKSAYRGVSYATGYTAYKDIMSSINQSSNINGNYDESFLKWYDIEKRVLNAQMGEVKNQRAIYNNYVAAYPTNPATVSLSSNTNGIVNTGAASVTNITDYAVNRGVLNHGTISTLNGSFSGDWAIENRGSITQLSGAAAGSTWGVVNFNAIGTVSGEVTGNGQGGALYNDGTITTVSGDYSGGTYGVCNNASTSKIENLAATTKDSGYGVSNNGTITQTSGTVSGGTWGLSNTGTYTQTGGSISGNSANTSGSNGGVYQNGTYKISGGATVTSGDVYLINGHYIEVCGALSNNSQVASIDCGDRVAGRTLVKVTYTSGQVAEDICSAYLVKNNGESAPKISLSKNILNQKVVTTNAPGSKDLDADYNYKSSEKHMSAISVGRGNQSSEIENPELIKNMSVSDYTNGSQGTVILSCWVNASYDTKAIEKLPGVEIQFKDSNNENRLDAANINLYKEGFSSSIAKDATNWNAFHNNTDYTVQANFKSNLSANTGTQYGSSNSLNDVADLVNNGESISDVLVAGKTYKANDKEQNNISYTFLGWSLQEDGSGYIYDSPTSFPIGNNYIWYPIFDVYYSIEYNSNYATPDRTEEGGKLKYITYDELNKSDKSIDNTKDNLNGLQEDSFFKITTLDKDRHVYSTEKVIDNRGPNGNIPNYWDKEIETTHKDPYTELDEDYTYWYKFIGWSLDKNSSFVDWTNTDNSKRVYKAGGENFVDAKEAYVDKTSRHIVNNDERNERVDFLINHSDLVYEKTDTSGTKYLCVTMYAIWDEYPEIIARDFTLMSNDDVFIKAENDSDDSLFKQKVIDSYVTKKDFEKKYKSDENLTVTVENLDYDAIKAIGHGGEDIGTVSVTVKVVDEVGNESYDTCDVTIISSTGMTSRTDGESAPLYVRFVDEKNWLKNDFWNIIFDNGSLSIEELTGTDNKNQQLENMELICNAYELWLTQTGVSSDVEAMLKDVVSDDTISKLKNLSTLKSNLKRVTDNHTDKGAMEPYSKWYLNPKLVLDINESFEAIVSNGI